MKKYWYQEQVRILQTVFREKDAGQYDAGSVIRYMKETDTNCLVVNAGGVVDFFPNNLEMGKAGHFMGSQDILKDLTRECHENGIRIIARVDFRGVDKERYERQPHWFGQNEDGSPLMGWNDRIYRPCYTSFYGSGHAEQFLEKLLREYDLDGVWENCVIFGFGPCYCPDCRESFRAYSGQEIPSGGDYYSEEFREYREWKSIYAKKHMDRMRDAVKRFGEDKAYVSEIFGMYHVSTSLSSGIDLYDAKDKFDFLVSPLFLDGSAQPDKKYEDFSHASSGIRFLKAIAPDKQSVALTGGNGKKWRYVTPPRLESRIWMLEVVSAGGTLWNTYFNGQHPGKTIDRRNAGFEQEIYRYLKDKETYLMNQVPAGEIGIFYSRQTRDVFGNDRLEEDEYGSFIKGVERVLFACHMPYRFVPDLDFSYEKLGGIKVLLLPNAACLSEEQMDVIRRFVEAGGGLVASYRTSLYDEKGKQRPDFGLKEVFGCSFTGITKDTGSDSYQKIRMKHPILEGMDIDRTEMIMNEEKTLLCTKQRTDYTTVCTYVPLIYNQPPEYAWIPDENTDYPTILAGQYGKGRVIYFSNQTDKACFTNGHEDFVNTYRNAVQWAAGGEIKVTADAPEGVHISLTENNEAPGKMVISFVNTTSGPFRPVRSLQPVFHLEVRIRNAVLKESVILREESMIEITQEEKQGKKQILIRVPMLQEFSAIYLDTEEGGVKE